MVDHSKRYHFLLYKSSLWPQISVCSALFVQKRRELHELVSTCISTSIPDASPASQQPTQDPTNHSRWPTDANYIYFIEQYRPLLSTYFCICPFQLLNWFYSIRWELGDETPMTNCYLSTFSPILGHHQRYVYCKSDATFTRKLLRFKCLLFILTNKLTFRTVN